MNWNANWTTMTLKSISSLIHKENVRLGSVDQCLGHWVHLVTFNTRVKNTMIVVQWQSIGNVFECFGRCTKSKNQGGEEQEPEGKERQTVGDGTLNLHKKFFFNINAQSIREQDEWYMWCMNKNNKQLVISFQISLIEISKKNHSPAFVFHLPWKKFAHQTRPDHSRHSGNSRNSPCQLLVYPFMYQSRSGV